MIRSGLVQTPSSLRKGTTFQPKGAVMGTSGSTTVGGISSGSGALRALRFLGGASERPRNGGRKIVPSQNLLVTSWHVPASSLPDLIWPAGSLPNVIWLVARSSVQSSE